MPVIVRVDGRSFHTFTKGLERPFDKVLKDAMKYTMKALCEDTQCCVFGYVQSDEITLVLTAPDRIKSEMYFGGEVAKIISITASKATRYFNKFFMECDLKKKYADKYLRAEFDCRTFCIPEWGIDWNDFTAYEKRGACCYKREETASVTYQDKRTKELLTKDIVRHSWYIDEEMPILTQDREWFSCVSGIQE